MYSKNMDNLKNYPEHKGHKVLFIDPYDAHYCLDCEKWLESKCGDDSCNMCKRPEKMKLALLNPNI